MLALPASDRLDHRLGGARQMEDLAWGGDYQHHVHARYYVDDYLLFPGFPRHSSHVLPEVAETWRPFFRRTLQALRAESPQNAARWLGSFLHFIEDSGSPPHALPTGGVLHTRMENYVLSLDIRLPGYRPREFARTEAGAEEEGVRRIEALVAFSRERAQRLLPLAERDDRRACEPLVLECALETSRAVADVTHSLLALSESGPRSGTAVLAGSLRASASPDFPLAPAKVMLAGTGFSTIADARPAVPGSGEYRADFVLADLPPGDQEIWVMRTGCVTERRRVSLRASRTTLLELTLRADEPNHHNLIRNPDLSVRWLVPGQPDCWTRVRDGWRSDAFRVQPGGGYLFGARDRTGPRVVTVRSNDNPRNPAGSSELNLSPEGESKVPGEYAQVLVRGDPEPVYVFARRAPPQ